ncbi:MAG TPA: mycothiol synthase, partial [Acidimicrobiia bacterium]|nr:mycothiol synthase [Acidimicrobiia bacterium]
MPEVELRRPVAAADVDTLRRVATAAERAAGHALLGDSVWRDLADPSPQTAIVIARDGERPLGVLHLGPQEGDESRGDRLSPAILPDAPFEDTLHRLVEAAIDDTRARGGDPVELLVFGADRRSDGVAADLGLKQAREMWQLRIGLPLREEPRLPPELTLRAFEPGRDEAAWLRVNNRAFAADPDQGGWDETVLAAREAEPWFDPGGFLLAFADRGLAGFCWTKVHLATPPIEPVALGEIYVIGVDPDHQGAGLGRG